MHRLITPVLLAGLVASAPLALADLPSSFDLRSVNGRNLVSSVKSQQGGTCWTHGTAAAIESNLLMTGAWTASGEAGEPDLAEYHLDWWNGFNRHSNPDIAPTTGGLTVHEGGDYLVASAYLTRGVGAVRNVDGQSYSSAPSQQQASYRFFYPRDIEWLAGSDSAAITRIKERLMSGGVVGTALAWSSNLYSSSTNSFYQPVSSTIDPNHAVSIVGWDDQKRTQASNPGAWLIKNSWGSSWGDRGYFWISYFDKVAGKHPEMGAVAFRNVEPMAFDVVYSHDTHGWRDTKTNATEAFNVFTARGAVAGSEFVKAVNFVTTADGAAYQIKVFGTFNNGELSDELASADGTAEFRGHHTVDLGRPTEVAAGQKIYVYVKVLSGGQAFDRTSEVPVLLGSKGKVLVESRAQPGESFYKTSTGWRDLTKDDASANFTIKALSVIE